MKIRTRRLFLERMESREFLSVNSAVFSELGYRIWVPDGSTATLGQPNDSLVSMDYDVRDHQNSMALLRGEFSIDAYPTGVDFSSGVTVPSRADSPYTISFHDIHGRSRHHQVDSQMASGDVVFNSFDFSGLAHIRKIDFIVSKDSESGTLHVGPPIELDPEPNSAVLSDLRFLVWAPEGTSVTLSESANHSRMNYRAIDSAQPIALLRGDFPAEKYPEGVDFSGGVHASIQTNATSFLIVYHDVNGQTNRQRISSVSTELTSYQLQPVDSLGNLRRVDFIVMGDDSSGYLHLEFSEPTPDPGKQNLTESEKAVRDLQFGVWATNGSSANLNSHQGEVARMDFHIDNVARSMAIMRGTFPTSIYPTGVDVSNGFTLNLISDVPTMLVTFHDIHGSARNLMVDGLVSANASTVQFLAADLSGLGNIRKIDFVVPKLGASGTLAVLQPRKESEPEPKPEDPCLQTNVRCIRSGDEVWFQQMVSQAGQSYRFLVFADAQLSGLDIIDRQGDEFIFLDDVHIAGNVQSLGHWTTDRGVVNITNSRNLLISGLSVTNEFQYQPVHANPEVQSSTAVNISWSHDIIVENGSFRGNGKNTIWIQGNSKVQLRDTGVDCYYFCVGVAASDVYTKNLNVSQFNSVVTADRHAMFWVSSTMRAAVDNRFYGNSNVVFEDTTIQKKTGEGMVVGNGGYDYRSQITFRGTTQIIATDYVTGVVDAWLPIHRNYNGITLHLEDTYPATTIDLATQPNTFGKFLIHRYGTTQAPPYESPLIVCIGTDCVSSNEVLGLDSP